MREFLIIMMVIVLTGSVGYYLHGNSNVEAGVISTTLFAIIIVINIRRK